MRIPVSRASRGAPAAAGTPGPSSSGWRIRRNRTDRRPAPIRRVTPRPPPSPSTGRVATRRPARQRGRFHIRNIVAGALLLAIAGLTVHFDLDVALLRLVSIALAGVGLVTLLKGLLGHGPTLP